MSASILDLGSASPLQVHLPRADRASGPTPDSKAASVGPQGRLSRHHGAGRSRSIALIAVLTLACSARAALAGPNAGGTLLVHSLEQLYTSEADYCGSPAPSSCGEVDSRVDDAGLPVVWTVLAVFSDANLPRLRGVEFGINHSGIDLVDWGSCADFELATPDWPASGSGTIVVWNFNQTERIVPVYWFAGSALSMPAHNRGLGVGFGPGTGPGGPGFGVGPHPVNGGHFGDDHIPSILDEIADYGELGFYVDGSAPCPGARTYVVRPDGTGDRETIQAVIDVAAPGSIIELADGVFRGEGNRDIRLQDTQLTLRSASGDPEACVIDCEGTPSESHRGFLMLHEWSAGPTIEGIKVINGYAGDDFEYDAEGGAIKMQGATLLYVRDCIFENCYANHAGGAIDSGGILDMEDCVIRDCSTGGAFGGGIYQSGDSLMLRRVRFEGNECTQRGGGLAITSSVADVENCWFAGNRADAGGGAYLSQSPATLSGCTWSFNEGSNGGGLYLRGGTIAITECTFADNLAAAGTDIYGGDTPGSLDLRNSILSFGLGGAAFRCGDLDVSAAYSDFYGNVVEDWPVCLDDQSTANGNFSLDPRFCDRPNRDYHINENSPCAVYWAAIRGIVGAWPVGCGESPVDTRSSASSPGAKTGGPGAGVANTTRLAIEPNPFGSTTDIVISLADGGPRLVRLQIFDVNGRKIRSLSEEVRGAGEQIVRWDGRDDAGVPAPEGIYFAHLRDGSHERAARMIALR